MSKDEILVELKKKGLNAKNENGVIIILFEDNYKEMLKFVDKIMREKNFRGSFGVRKAKQGEMTESQRIEAIENEDEE